MLVRPALILKHQVVAFAETFGKRRFEPILVDFAKVFGPEIQSRIFVMLGPSHVNAVVTRGYEKIGRNPQEIDAVYGSSRNDGGLWGAYRASELQEGH